MIAILLLAALAAPGTWLRTAPAPADFRPLLEIKPLPVVQRAIGGFAVLGAWELASANTHFGSYSALLAMPDGTLFAASDRGRFLRFTPPGERGAPRFGWLAGDADTLKEQIDIEAMTRDPASGRVWFAYEGTNAIERRDSKLRSEETARPQSMAGFGANSGPEAFARLADGRFVVLSEGPRKWLGSHHPGVLFSGDPVAGGKATTFTFVSDGGYKPVDMVQIPDGRILILLRRLELGIPPGFSGKVLIADPADIANGGEWRGEQILALDERLPSDNYEGLAVDPQPDGSLVLWLIADDNNAVLQRTLLLKLRWVPGQ
nr:esterase-like activity of phytase family protein [Parerythrobacter lacustris]